ncbi:class I SAM-dependent methyltransferase [Corynebacterium sp. 239_CJEI]|uniref:class I SAM-dependent methyltransferase n=1 Tax=Corynebacterium sp. 239_CJEI TaxID=2715674 RepID=UPI000666E467|nr:class I SAM-dependent methyltransferase [Corynebacterium sp. 239_CJEI]
MLGVNEHPPIPPTSARDTPTFRDAADRHRAGATFDNDLQESADGATGYHRVRPGYPPTVIEALTRLAPHPQVVADIGAGTGKLTASLADVYRDATLLALDPSTAMRQALMHNVPAAECLEGTAERTGLESNSVDVATCAQTWHWVDPTAASKELTRVLRADSVAMLVWNTLDVSVPWVHRLSRIMHAGDVLRPGFYPEVGPELELVDEVRLAWEQTLTIEDIVLLARTRSYWLRSKPATRAKVEANLHWYLHEHLGHTYEEGIALPYRCDAFYFRAA